MTTSPQCSKQVYVSGGSFRGHRCERASALVEEGKGWCRQHAPSTVSARKKERNARHEAEWQLTQAAWKREAAVKEATRDLIAACREARDGYAKDSMPEGIAYALSVLDKAEGVGR